MKWSGGTARGAESVRNALGGPGIEWCDTTAGSVRILRNASDVGPRLLFAADGPNVLEHYGDIVSALNGRADVTIFEPPGTGGSVPVASFGFRLCDFADNVSEILQHVGPRVLVFPCYMSFVAGALARKQHPKVRGLVLPQGPSWSQMHLWMERVDPYRLLRTPVLGQLIMRAMPRRVAKGWYAGSAGPAARDRLAAVADDVLHRGGCFCLASLTQQFGRDAVESDDLGSVPSVVAWGDLDRSHGRPAAVGFPQADEIQHFTACGHSPELEAPRAFATWLLEWCSDRGLGNATCP